jgi:endonuclease V-like protein UPF0215 family
MTRTRRLSHVIAFDDGPFDRAHRGDVPLAGVVFAGARLDGVMRGRVRRDGANAARVMADLIARSRFVEHLQLIMLQGIAVAGFNVVDVFALQAATRLPIVVVSSRAPNLDAVRRALLTRVPGGSGKWRIIDRLGPMEKCEGVWIQRIGLTAEEAATVVRRFAVNGKLPEPLRIAHLVASAL